MTFRRIFTALAARLFARNYDTTRIFVIKIPLLIISLITIGLVIFFSLRHRDGFEKMIFYELNDGSYGKVPQSRLEEAVPKLTWPKYQGYNNRDVRPNTHPPDSLLLHRIELAEHHQKHPLIRIQKGLSTRGRHPWKFEKIIHQSWINASIPARTAPWVKKWLQLHPDWTYMFWTDETMRDFIVIYFPSLLPSYDSWSLPVLKTDHFRYIILYAFGGVWADLDMEPLRPLDEIREWGSCILSREPDAQVFVMSDIMCTWANFYTFTCNAFMACRSHHPFLHYLIARTVQNSPLVTKQDCTKDRVILCTGPWMLSLSWGFYLRSLGETTRKRRNETDVVCPEFGWFLPTFDDSRMDLVRQECFRWFMTKKQAEICQWYEDRNFENKPFAWSFTTHYWVHSYHKNINIDLVDLKTVTKALMWSKESRFEFSVCYTDKCTDLIE